MTDDSKSDTFPHEWIWVVASSVDDGEYWMCSKCGAKRSEADPEREGCAVEK